MSCVAPGHHTGSHCVLTIIVLLPLVEVSVCHILVHGNVWLFFIDAKDNFLFNFILYISFDFYILTGEKASGPMLPNLPI